VPAAADEEILVLLFADVDAAATAADEHTGAGLSSAEARVAPRLTCGDHTEERGS
jgi:hypothetical protein